MRYQPAYYRHSGKVPFQSVLASFFAASIAGVLRSRMTYARSLRLEVVRVRGGLLATFFPARWAARQVISAERLAKRTRPPACPP